MSRRDSFWVVSALGLGALLTEGVLLGPRRLTVSHHTLGDADAGWNPIRLAILTDLHLKRIGGFHEELATALREARADVLLFVGDSVDHPDGLPVLADLLSLLPPEPLRFATLGTWE